MIDVERLKALAALQPEDIRGSEENLKQKFLVPLLEAFKHEKRYLDFERPVHGGRLDVFVTGLPKDCKVAVETKRFGEDLDLHLTQIAKYAALEGLLVTVITNGDEIRIYSPLGGIGFDRCLLHSIKRQELASDSAIEILRKFLSRESLVTKRVHQHVNERGTELRQAYEKLEKLNDDYGTLRENIYADMAKLEAQIESNRKEIDELEAKRQAEERDLWRQLGLPLAGSGPTSPPVPPAEQHPRSETDTIDFEALILSTLQEIGGQGNVREILMRIENKLRAKGELTPYWQEPDPTQIRWKHAVHSARFRLVKQGKMSGKTETGVWELTEQGRRAARNLSKG